jgi:hypothetical protein
MLRRAQMLSLRSLVTFVVYQETSMGRKGGAEAMAYRVPIYLHDRCIFGENRPFSPPGLGRRFRACIYSAKLYDHFLPNLFCLLLSQWSTYYSEAQSRSGSYYGWALPSAVDSLRIFAFCIGCIFRVYLYSCVFSDVWSIKLYCARSFPHVPLSTIL